MFGADVLRSQLRGFDARTSQAVPRRLIEADATTVWRAPNGQVPDNFLDNPLWVDSLPTQEPSGDRFGDGSDREKNMLGPNPIMLEERRFLARQCDDLAAHLGESAEAVGRHDPRSVRPGSGVVHTPETVVRRWPRTQLRLAGIPARTQLARLGFR